MTLTAPAARPGWSDADRLPVLALFLPACFIIEVILGGPFGVYRGVSVRLWLFGGSCAVLAFALLVRGRVVRAHLVPIVSVIGFVAVNGLWVAVVPVLARTNMHWSLREPHAFGVLLLVVLILALLRPGQLAATVSRLQRLVVVTSLVLAAFQVGLWVFGTLLGELKWVVPFALGVLFPGSSDQLYVGTMPDGFFRVFWISTLWCILGFFWIPIALPSTRFLWVFRGLLVLDLVVAYSRGIWVGLVVGLMIAFGVRLTGHDVGRRLTRFAMTTAIAAAALLGVLAATGSLERGVARFASTTSREDASIGARVEQAPYLLRLWYEHPVIGNGYGAYSTVHVRSPESPYSYEHMPYALLAKLGLVGLLVSGAFLVGWVLTAWQVRRRYPAETASFLGSSAALLVAEMTNPMVLNFVSMTILACLLLQWANLISMPAPGRTPGQA